MKPTMERAQVFWADLDGWTLLFVDRHGTEQKIAIDGLQHATIGELADSIAIHLSTEDTGVITVWRNSRRQTGSIKVVRGDAEARGARPAKGSR